MADCRVKSSEKYLTKKEFYRMIRAVVMSCGGCDPVPGDEIPGFPKTLVYNNLTNILTLTLTGGRPSLFTTINLTQEAATFQWETFPGVSANFVDLANLVPENQIVMVIKDAKAIFNTSLVPATYESWTYSVNGGGTTRINLSFTGFFNFIAVGYLL